MLCNSNFIYYTFLAALFDHIFSNYAWNLLTQGDECGSLTEFGAHALVDPYSFSNFSFKVILAVPDRSSFFSI